MTKTKLQSLKGFRDFLPEEARLRAYVKNIFISVFESYGFSPLETPVLEYASTLLDKYGDEADKLVYRFRDNGDRDVAMRYDLTVPTAKVMAMYGQELKLPFKRYQIDKVWRADKPQASRYREFVQADIDIFGVSTPLADAEILIVVGKVLQSLGLNNFVFKINSRASLNNILEISGIKDNKNSILQSLDKLDKIDYSGVKKELILKNLNEDQITSIFTALEKSTPDLNLQKTIVFFLRAGFSSSNIVYSPTIVRGLDYYTGMIFETGINNLEIGSVASGGRYDNLISSLGGPPVSAVGVGMGFDRIVDSVKKLNLQPVKNQPVKLLIANFDDSLQSDYLELQSFLQSKNIACMLYPETTKLAKQIKYALDNKINFLAISGSEEKQQNKWLLKNLITQTQELVEKEGLLLV